MSVSLMSVKRDFFFPPLTLRYIVTISRNIPLSPDRAFTVRCLNTEREEGKTFFFNSLSSFFFQNFFSFCVCWQWRKYSAAKF